MVVRCVRLNRGTEINKAEEGGMQKRQQQEMGDGRLEMGNGGEDSNRARERLYVV